MANPFDCRIVLDKNKGVTIEIEQAGDSATRIIAITMDDKTVEIVQGERPSDDKDNANLQRLSWMSLGADGEVVVDCKKFTVKAEQIELFATDKRTTFAEENPEELPMGSLVLKKESCHMAASKTDVERSELALFDAKASWSTVNSDSKKTTLSLTPEKFEADTKGNGAIDLKAGEKTNIALKTASATMHGKETANVEASPKTTIALSDSSAVHTVSSGAILTLSKTKGDLDGDLAVTKGITGGGGAFTVNGGSGAVAAPKIGAG